MRSRVRIIAVALCVASQLPALAQESGQSRSDADSYREQLRALSTDNGSSRPSPSSDDDSRRRYKDQLRRLAGGEDNGNTTSNDSSPSIVVTSQLESRGASAATSDGSNAQRSVPVSLQRDDVVSRNKSAAQNVSPSTNSTADCQDAYCAQLRRVADGNQQIATPRVENGRRLTTERNFVKNLAVDQMQIWTSPFRMKDSDATWAVPFGIVAGSLFATDRDLSKQLAKANRQSISKKISDAGLFGSMGVGAGFYGLGLITADEHKRETGLLAGEAFINATLVAQALKVSFGRQRPFEGDGFGHIGRGGSSFPSEHAIGTWAIASVVAHEYPNPLIQIGAYGLAATVAATRVTAGQHFPSDVLVGSAFGYLIGRQVYKAHHNPELGGSEYGTFIREQKRDAAHSGSAYVPLESWVYPVIDRLAAFGLIHSNFDSERPFTRLECARLAQEAAENATGEDLPADQGARDQADPRDACSKNSRARTKSGQAIHQTAPCK